MSGAAARRAEALSSGRRLRMRMLAGAALCVALPSAGAADHADGTEAPANAWQPCAYWSGDGFDAAPACVRDVDGVRAIHPDLLRRLPYAANGTAWLSIDRQDVLVKRDGRALPVVHVDNGPDDFVEGLVRARIDGKVGYFDADFRQVIAPVFDFAWPFANGRATVCMGCRAGLADADGHVPMVGGRWFTIDRRGNELRD